jgi:hypothetical protein
MSKDALVPLFAFSGWLLFIFIIPTLLIGRRKRKQLKREEEQFRQRISASIQ